MLISVYPNPISKGEKDYEIVINIAVWLNKLLNGVACSKCCKIMHASYSDMLPFRKEAKVLSLQNLLIFLFPRLHFLFRHDINGTSLKFALNNAHFLLHPALNF